MGLLMNSNSRNRRGKFVTVLLSHCNKICVLFYVTGLIWFCLLAWEHCNNRTYFSENALLPGLVKREFSLGNVANQLYQSLKEEAKHHPGIPYAWLQAHFRQQGLEVYLHNFTLHYPFGSKPKYKGKNLYAILRAPKTASTEALVLSTPYRGFDNIHGSSLPGIALMVSLAQAFRRQTNWGKDIIFLVVDYEMVGFQAWLEAYHDSCTSSNVLDSGILKSRSGAIQAAINLEIKDEKIHNFDIKIEGLNGQLPNLDLFNLAVELCSRESVPSTFHLKSNVFKSQSWKGFTYSFTTMLSMMGTQATGLPSAGHGLFHRYAIQAITLHGSSDGFGTTKVTFTQMGRVLEGIFRSLNNLLERFHQSFFFYLLPSTRRYISIGLYMPSFCLVAAPVLIKALYLYLSLQHIAAKGDTSSKQESTFKNDKPSLWSSLYLIIGSHLFGLLVFLSPESLDSLGKALKFSMNDSLYYGISILLIVSLVSFACGCKFIKSQDHYKIYKCVTLLELGAFVYTLSLINISLATAISVIYIPVAVSTGDLSKSILKWLHCILLILLHPFILIFLILVLQSFSYDNNATLIDHISRAYSGHKKVLLFTIEDCFLYNNWSFGAAVAVLLPIWLQLWLLDFGSGM